MADNTSNSDRFARDAQRRTTAATAIGMICLEANYALSGLNAEDVSRQYRKVCGQLRKGVRRNRDRSRGTV
jgi:hypothetical protein